jgi:hypothetical protein
MLDKAGPGAASPALDSALVNGAGEALDPAALDVLLLIHLFANACWRQAQASAKSSAHLQPQGGTWLFYLAVGATPSLNDSSRAAAITATTDTA